MKEEPGGFVDGDDEPEEEAAAAAADGDEEDEEEDDDDDDDGDELGYLHETTTQGGLAGALEMARGRGMLGADGPTSAWTTRRWTRRLRAPLGSTRRCSTLGCRRRRMPTSCSASSRGTAGRWTARTP